MFCCLKSFKCPKFVVHFSIFVCCFHSQDATHVNLMFSYELNNPRNANKTKVEATKTKLELL